MAISPRCGRCPQDLDAPGAVLFLCSACMEELIGWMRDGPFVAILLDADDTDKDHAWVELSFADKMRRFRCAQAMAGWAKELAPRGRETVRVRIVQGDFLISMGRAAGREKLSRCPQ